jgi:hypothetical protein
LRRRKVGVADRPGQRVQHRRLVAEVARGPTYRDRGQARTGDLDTRCDRLEGLHHRLEQARFGGLVAGQDDEFGAAGLRLAAAQPTAHSGQSRLM